MTDTSWYPGEYRPDPAYPPHYSTMPEYLRVVDTCYSELEGRALDFWKRCRKAAFAQWELLDLDILFRYNTSTAYKANRVTLSFMKDMGAEYGANKPALHCFEVCQPCQPGVTGCDWVRIDRGSFDRAVKSRVPTQIVYLIAHEFGHSLGFGHGGTGIMDQTPDHAHVNAEEIEAARAYWGL